MATSGTATITAGTTSVIVEHIYGKVPDYIGLTAVTDLDGRSLSYESVTTTQFTITIDSPDIIDHVINWTFYVQATPTNVYCTITQAKTSADFTYEELGFESDTAFETFIGTLIDRASRYIDRYTQRSNGYFNGGATITEIVDSKTDTSTIYLGTDRFINQELNKRRYKLQQSPVLSITSVHKNTADVGASDSWIEISSSNYRVNLNTGEVVLAAGMQPTSGVLNMRFIYKAGYEAVPDDVRWACEDLVANALKKMHLDQVNGHIRFRTPSPIAFGNDSVFTSDIKMLLAPYRKVRM